MMKHKFSPIFLCLVASLLLVLATVGVSAQVKVQKPAPPTVKPVEPIAKPSETPVKPQTAKPESAKPEASKPGSADKTASIEFPEVEGWSASEIRNYPVKELGYSIGYNSETGGTVTIYVYDKGLKTIPDDLTHDLLKDEIEIAAKDIFKAKELGAYQKVKQEKSDQIVLGGTSGKTGALRRTFTIVVKERELTSEIYLFGFQNNFVKIRATRPKIEGETANAAVAALFAEIDGLFADLKTLSSK